MQLDVYLEDDFRGTVTFGLIQGMDAFAGNVVPELSANYIICKAEVKELSENHKYFLSFSPVERYNGIVSLAPVYLAIIFAVIAIILCIAGVAFTFVNTYQVVLQWWRGPATIYVLSLLISE